MWRLSGPGQRLQLEDRVNISDETAGESLMISLRPLNFQPQRTLPPEIDEAPEACGYPSHTACSGLFSAAGSIEPSDIHLIANLCRSNPIQHGLMNWNHDYGGLVNFWAQDFGGLPDAQTPPTPGEEARLWRIPESLNDGPDPWDTPEIARVFNLPAALSTSVTSQALHTWIIEEKDEGSFGRLPNEILSMILVYLSSADVARLRLASRLFANFVLPDGFWRSLFLPEQEFDYIFEARQPSLLHRGSWKQIYAAFCILQAAETMMERKRIRNLALSLHGLMQMLRDTKCEGSPVQSFFEPDAPPKSCSPLWVTAKGALRGNPTELRDDFCSGSRSLFERELRLAPPEQIVAIFASAIDLFGRTYISGIRIVDSN